MMVPIKTIQWKAGDMDVIIIYCARKPGLYNTNDMWVKHIHTNKQLIKLR